MSIFCNNPAYPLFSVHWDTHQRFTEPMQKDGNVLSSAPSESPKSRQCIYSRYESIRHGISSVSPTTGKIDDTLWKTHVPSLLPTQVPTCEECSEFEERTCAGGRDTVECFLAKGVAGETEDEHKQKKRDPMLGLGVKRAKSPRYGKAKRPVKDVKVNCKLIIHKTGKKVSLY